MGELADEMIGHQIYGRSWNKLRHVGDDSDDRPAENAADRRRRNRAANQPKGKPTMKLPTLYQLGDEYLVAFQQLQESELPQQVITDTLEGLSGDFETKATAIMQMAKNNEALAKQIDEAMAAMQERSATLKRHAERLEAYILENMERAKIQEVSCPYFKITLAKNPPKLVQEEGAIVPSEYMTIPKIPDPQPDKKAIKAALEAGKIIPGFKLERGTRLKVT